jgi:hypothetical protein
MALSQAPARTASRPVPPTDQQAVLSYLAVGHTTAETAQRFGIAERSVRRIRQRQDERHEQSRRTQHIAAQRPAEQLAVPCVKVVPPPSVLTPPHFAPARPSDVAGKGVLWRCPVTGALIPVPPGAMRGEWEADRRSPTPHKEPDTTLIADVVASPDIRTGQPFTALERATDSGPTAITQPLPTLTTVHNSLAPISIKADYVRQREAVHLPKKYPRTDVDLAQLIEVLAYQIGPVPVASLLLFLMLLWLIAH